jgi:hypothetical protein
VWAAYLKSLMVILPIALTVAFRKPGAQQN